MGFNSGFKGLIFLGGFFKFGFSSDRRLYFRFILWDLGVRSLVILVGSNIESLGSPGLLSTSVGVTYLHRPHSDIFTSSSLKTHYITLSVKILHIPCHSFLVYSLCLIVYLCMTTLAEGFPCFFVSCKANARVKPAKTGHGPHSSLFMYFSMHFLCCSMYCLFCVVHCIFVCICVLYYCHRVATKLQLNISYHISYNIIYHIISYHIISYIISYHISYISYHIIYLIMYHTIPYRTIYIISIISYTISYHTISHHNDLQCVTTSEHDPLTTRYISRVWQGIGTCRTKHVLHFWHASH